MSGGITSSLTVWELAGVGCCNDICSLFDLLLTLNFFLSFLNCVYSLVPLFSKLFC